MKITTLYELYDIFTPRYYDKDIVFPITLYYASNKFKCVQEYIYKKKPIIYLGLRDSLFIAESVDDDGFGINSFSLRDANIGGANGYNDWFVFTTQEEAEAYARPPKKNTINPDKSYFPLLIKITDWGNKDWVVGHYYVVSHDNIPEGIQFQVIETNVAIRTK